MISKSMIYFDGTAQTGGGREERYLREELLSEEGGLELVRSLLLRLPFRLRLGSRATFDVKGTIPARITVINSVDIPSVEVGAQLLQPLSPTIAQLASDVLITLRPLKLDIDRKALLASAITSPDYAKAVASARIHVHPEDWLKPLDPLIIQYIVLGGTDIHWNRVRRIFRKDISGGQPLALYMFKRRHDAINDDELLAGAAGAILRSAIPFEAGGPCHDCPVDLIAKLHKELSRDSQYGFYSMAVQAQDFMRQTDFLNALLYAVIAFENAHSELIEFVAETKAGSSSARKWAQQLIKEGGIHSFVHLTPFLFMEPENRPTDDVVSKVKKAIEYRNDIAHAKRDSKRNLKIARTGPMFCFP